MSEDALAPDGAETDAGFDGSPEVAQLRAELDAANKRIVFAEESAVAARRPHWIGEQRRLNPELDLLLGPQAIAGIQAPSRRAFARKVEELRDIHAPTIERLKGLREEATASVTTAREEAAEQARREVQLAWGKPTSDAISAPARDPKADLLKKLAE